MNAIIPKNPISIRVAVASDLSFIDGLQKIHTKNVGWMQTAALEKKIEKGEVLVAEGEDRGSKREDGGSKIEDGQNPSSILHLPSSPIPVGYCMAQDRYFKRDDVGIIYQMNVVPGHQRGLIGASLLKAQFERSAYGCKLYCCWCAQDIAANKFWEAMGFVPLAFRAGSEKKSRVHIFWQRRIRAGDNETPYWFPSQTTGGSIREDRLVLPIPPGTHWSDAKPMILPKEVAPTPALPRGGRSTGRGSRVVQPPTGGGVRFGRPSATPEVAPVVKPVKARKPKVRNDPKLVAAARELRDRWLEQVNAEGGEKLLVGSGKYDVSRPALSGAEGALPMPANMPLLAA